MKLRKIMLGLLASASGLGLAGGVYVFIQPTTPAGTNNSSSRVGFLVAGAEFRQNSKATPP